MHVYDIMTPVRCGLGSYQCSCLLTTLHIGIGVNNKQICIHSTKLFFLQYNYYQRLFTSCYSACWQWWTTIHIQHIVHTLTFFCWQDPLRTIFSWSSLGDGSLSLFSISTRSLSGSISPKMALNIMAIFFWCSVLQWFSIEMIIGYLVCENP